MAIRLTEKQKALVRNALSDYPKSTLIPRGHHKAAWGLQVRMLGFVYPGRDGGMRFELSVSGEPLPSATIDALRKAVFSEAQEKGAADVP